MRTAFLLALASLAAPVDLLAQESAPYRRTQCEAIAEAARGSFTAVAPDRALDLRHCDRIAPPMLARAWREGGLDSAEVHRLAAVSASVRDRRVLDAALAAAETRGLSSHHRVRAMQVLAAYAWPGLSMYDDWLRPENSTLGPATTSGAFVIDGEIPIHDVDVRRAVESLAGIAERETDTWVRFAARRLHLYASARLREQP